MKKSFLFLALLMLVASCSSDDDQPSKSAHDCDMNTIVSANQYENAPADAVQINNLSITGNCLKVKFSASGCDGASWEVKLIDADAVMESFPPQRNLRLSLKNQELCAAIVNKTLTFDIANLQVDGDQVMLNLVNTGEGILYEY